MDKPVKIIYTKTKCTYQMISTFLEKVVLNLR